MKNLNEIQMWTAQTPKVWNIVEKDGYSMVKEEYLEEKYGDVVWIFKTAYSYIKRKMKSSIPNRYHAESPIWVYRSPMWLSNEGNAVVQCLQIPKEEILLFDLKKWYQVLNLEMVGNPGEKAAFEEELKRQGIKDALDVFRTPYYPLLKQQIMESWERIFDIEETEEEYLQGATWCLKKEWLQDIG